MTWPGGGAFLGRTSTRDILWGARSLILRRTSRRWCADEQLEALVTSLFPASAEPTGAARRPSWNSWCKAGKGESTALLVTLSQLLGSPVCPAFAGVENHLVEHLVTSSSPDRSHFFFPKIKKSTFFLFLNKLYLYDFHTLNIDFLFRYTWALKTLKRALCWHPGTFQDRLTQEWSLSVSSTTRKKFWKSLDSGKVSPSWVTGFMKNCISFGLSGLSWADWRLNAGWPSWSLEEILRKSQSLGQLNSQPLWDRLGLFSYFI